MKKLRIIALVFLVIPMINSYCQGSDILEQFAALDLKNGKEVISEDITVKALEDESLGITLEDSLQYKYIDKLYQKRLVRLDLATVHKTFPEVISITPEGDSILDYQSLIPLMMEAIQEQQKLIKDLEGRIRPSEAQSL